MQIITFKGRSVDDLTREFCEQMANMSAEEARAALATSGTYMNLLGRAIRTWYRSKDNAPEPLVGVGCITFADQRLQTFMRRMDSVVSRSSVQ
jgi:hypothetical protein